ncbi:AAA family ATPase [Sulfurimonas sp.]|uniref:AAA family ATPase n=1 Tax=Sulfurimonas sp. TaxID=2022749 RepID=UPI0025F4824C|nr:AAA family ATPase [Sulfurimonas sp.]MCK9454007.1 AAA family ATPase [Sulfurimonas sp.]
MSKESIYKQIENFNNTKENPNDPKPLGSKYFYIDSKKASESALFIKELIHLSKLSLSNSLNIMDLCFGSANLTSHVIFDTPLNIDHIYLNDLETSVTNQNIDLDSKITILNNDFLNFTQFLSYEKTIDFLVFNPTISDTERFRKISIQDSDKIIEYKTTLPIKDAFEDYYKTSNYIIKSFAVDSTFKLITIEFDNTTDELTDLPNSFNNYSIKYKTKRMNDYKDKSSTITEINKTISTVLKDDGVVLFVGTDSQRKAIFQNYNVTYRYIRSDNDVFIMQKKDIKVIECYELIDNSFVLNEDCQATKINDAASNDNINDLFKELDDLNTSSSVKCINLNIKQADKTMKTGEIEKFMFSNALKGKLTFPHKNILLKGVPGTGKSKTIDNIIFDDDKLNMGEIQNNILRINIHSASSNSDLMQGISISTTDNKQNVIYKEKQGAILSHIFKAIYKPKQPFVLILEEIQENSLNELIGDLIYLIEDTKRTAIELDIPDGTGISYDELFNKIDQKFKENDKTLHHVELPSLVENSDTNIKMIIPKNLFIFCTSNYRDDKKVIEDNLLRRFDVIEIYPKNRKQVGKDENGEYIFKSDDVSKFLEKLNNQILEQFKNETHPDRYMIGHANWLDIQEDSEDSQIAFYKALLKVIIEFKEIREIDFDSEVKPILEEVFRKDENISNRLEGYLKIFYNDDKLELKSYKNIVDILQQKVYKSFF